MIIPLLSILDLSEKTYSLIGGETGVVIAGFITSSLLGVVYFSPIALLSKKVIKKRFNYKILLSVVAVSFIGIVISLLLANQLVMMLGTSLFVLSTITLFSTLFANAIIRLFF